MEQSEFLWSQNFVFVTDLFRQKIERWVSRCWVAHWYHQPSRVKCPCLSKTYHHKSRVLIPSALLMCKRSRVQFKRELMYLGITTMFLQDCEPTRVPNDQHKPFHFTYGSQQLWNEPELTPLSRTKFYTPRPVDDPERSH